MIPVLITQRIHLAMKIYSLCQFVISCLLGYCYFPWTRELKIIHLLMESLYTHWLINKIILQFSKLLCLKKKVPRIIIHFPFSWNFHSLGNRQRAHACRRLCPFLLKDIILLLLFWLLFLKENCIWTNTILMLYWHHFLTHQPHIDTCIIAK